MKTTYIFSPLLIGVVALVWVSASGGVAKIQQVDRTGAPGSEPNCTMCHSGGSFSSSSTVVIKDMSGQAVTSYMPENQYSVTVEINSSGNNGHGFQLTGLLDDNSIAGSCDAVTNGTQKTSLNSKWYFEHNGNVSGGSYEMTWTAPVSGSGDVTFYGSALATNGDGGTGGDEYTNIPNVTLTEATPNSVNELKAVQLNLFPNPVLDVLNITSTDGEIKRVVVYDLTGQQVKNLNWNQSSVIVRMNDLDAGIYLVKVSTSNSERMERIVKY